MGQGGFEISGMEFGVQAGLSQGGGVDAEAQGGKVRHLNQPATSAVMQAGMEAVGGVEPEGAPAPGQFFEDHQEMVVCAQQQGVVVEGGVREAPRGPASKSARPPPPGGLAAGKSAGAAGRRSKCNPGDSPGR